MDIGFVEQLNAQIKELESWYGQLFFPYDGPENERVEFCLFLRHFCTVEYTYQFPDKYAGKDSLNILRRDLLLAAKHCGYELVTYSNQISKVAAGVVMKVTFSCSRHRCYKGLKHLDGGSDSVLSQDISCHGTVLSKTKRYNNMSFSRPTTQVRKTKTLCPITSDELCPFKFSIELREDGYWYMSPPRRNSMSFDTSLKHMWHPKLGADETSNLSVRYASQTQMDKLKKNNKCHIKCSLSANLLSTISDFRWLPSQVKYCSVREEQLLSDVSTKLTSADCLLSYLRSRDDISFVVLTDSSDGLVVKKGKG